MCGRMYAHKYFANGRLTDFSLIADALLISDSSSAQFRKIAFQPSQYVARINSCNQIFAVQNPYITDKASHSFGQLTSLDCRLVYTLPMLVQVSSGILPFHSSTLFRCPAVQWTVSKTEDFKTLTTSNLTRLGPRSNQLKAKLENQLTRTQVVQLTADRYWEQMLSLINPLTPACRGGGASNPI